MIAFLLLPWHNARIINQWWQETSTHGTSESGQKEQQSLAESGRGQRLVEAYSSQKYEQTVEE